MPVLDMPLEELKQYQGINPKPHDFDTYWDEALRELEQQDLSYTLEKDEFEVEGVECYHLYFTGVGGAKIHCKFLKPAHIEGKIPALAMFHGYQGHCGDWSDKLPYVYNDMIVAAMDVRGQAGLSEDNLQTKGNTLRGHIVRGVTDEDPKNLAYRAIYLDTAQLARILMSMPFVDETRVGACGYSQGGALTLACAALEPRIKVASVGAPFLCDYKRVWEMDMIYNNGAYEEILLHFRFKDPQHKKADEFWTRLGYIDLQYLAPRIKADTTFFVGLMDNICPPSAQFAAYNKITASKKLEIYPNFSHEGLPGYADKVLQLMRNL
jgi:cephalosporin-C deacetylase